MTPKLKCKAVFDARPPNYKKTITSEKEENEKHHGPDSSSLKGLAQVFQAESN